MPNKTLYVKEDDVHIWDTAALAAGEGNLSSYVTEALRQRLAAPEPIDQIGRIEVALRYETEYGQMVQRKAFQGRWLIPPVLDAWAIAVTQKGQFVFYSVAHNEFRVEAKLEDLRELVDEETYAWAEMQLNPVEELDI